MINSSQSATEICRYAIPSIIADYPIIEQWASDSEKLNSIYDIHSDIQTHLSEARQYPEEDFLEGIIAQVRCLMPKTGAKVKDFQELLDDLDKLQLATARATEYGMDELCKAEAALSI